MAITPYFVLDIRSAVTVITLEWQMVGRLLYPTFITSREALIMQVM